MSDIEEDWSEGEEAIFEGTIRVGKRMRRYIDSEQNISNHQQREGKELLGGDTSGSEETERVQHGASSGGGC